MNILLVALGAVTLVGAGIFGYYKDVVEADPDWTAPDYFFLGGCAGIVATALMMVGLAL